MSTVAGKVINKTTFGLFGGGGGRKKDEPKTTGDYRRKFGEEGYNDDFKKKLLQYQRGTLGEDKGQGYFQYVLKQYDQQFGLVTEYGKGSVPTQTGTSANESKLFNKLNSGNNEDDKGIFGNTVNGRNPLIWVAFGLGVILLFFGIKRAFK